MDPKTYELRIVNAEFPNGDPYGVFYLGEQEIGRAARVADGWIVFGKRKTLPRIHAAKAMIDSMLNRVRQDEEHALRLMGLLRKHNGGTLPPSR